MPYVDTVTVHGPSRLAKYESEFTADNPSITRGIFTYGGEPWCLVGLLDLAPTAEATIAAHPDVFELPADLETTMASVGVRNQRRSQLETANIPGTWIQTTTTYREVLRFVGACCQFMQGYEGLDAAPIFTGGITLDTTYGTLTTVQRQAVSDAALWMGLSTVPLVTTDTLRTVLQALGNDFVSQYAAGHNLRTRMDLAGPV